MGKPRRPSDASSSHVGYLFNFLLLANFIQYMEAGAVPALLVIIAKSFEMDSGEQGLLGGVVYLSLGIGGPFAGYLLRRYEHKRVIVLAVALNMVFTVLWAMTPIHHTYSTTYYIIMRFMMGLCQCIICVYLPLWTSENAPRDKRTIWMSYLQASVPLGVMMGYIVASIFMNFAQSSVTCGSILCWRWPFLIEIILLSPLYLALYFVPVEYMALSVHARGKRNPISRVSSKNQINDDPTILKSIPSEDSGHVPLPDFTPSESEANNINTKNSNNSTNSTSKVYSKDITSKPQQLGADLGERRRRLALRRHSMTASMFDPLYSRDVVRRSIDDLSLYDSSDSLLDLFAGFTSAWSGNGTGTGGNGSRRSSSISPADQPQDSMFLAFDGTEDDFNYNNSQRRPPVRSLPNQRQSYPLYMPSNHMNLPHHHHHPQQQQQQHQPIAGLYGSIGGLGSSSNNNGNGSSNYSSANNSNRNSIQLQHPITPPDSNNNSDSLKYESLRDIHKKTLYDDLIPGRKRTLSNSQSSSPMIAIAASNSSMQPPLQSQHISSNGEVKDSTDHIVVVVDSPPSDQYHYYHSPTADELQNTESSMIYNSDDEEDGDEDDDDGSESEEEWISPVKAPRPPTHNTHAIANGLTSTTTEEGQQLLLNGNNPNHNNNSSNSSYYRRNSLNGHGERKLTWVRTLRRLLSLSIYRNILGGTVHSLISIFATVLTCFLYSYDLFVLYRHWCTILGYKIPHCLVKCSTHACQHSLRIMCSNWSNIWCVLWWMDY